MTQEFKTVDAIGQTMLLLQLVLKMLMVAPVSMRAMSCTGGVV